jgi:hypothetical protein
MPRNRTSLKKPKAPRITTVLWGKWEDGRQGVLYKIKRRELSLTVTPNCGAFVVVHVKYREQLGDLQKIVHFLSQVQQF